MVDFSPVSRYVEHSMKVASLLTIKINISGGIFLLKDKTKVIVVKYPSLSLPTKTNSKRIFSWVPFSFSLPVQHFSNYSDLYVLLK